MIMTSNRYLWGQERPKTMLERALNTLETGIPKMRAKALAEYEARLASASALESQTRKLIALIERATVSGRFDRTAAQAAAIELGFTAAPKREPGRPPVNGPDNARARRRSRATTSASRLRSASIQPTATPSLHISPTETFDTGLTETASPAPPSVPKASPELGRTLLESTIAGSRGVDVIEPEAIQIDVAISDTSISVETKVEPTLSEVVPAPAKSVVDETDFVERPLPSFLARPLGFDQEYQDELDAADLAEARERHFLRFMEGRTWERGDHGAFKHDYDFTDPQSAPDEVKDVFKGFGLSTVSPTYNEENPDQSMKEEDVLKWLYVKYLNDDR